MALIFETEFFTFESHEKPEIDRREGGHAKINPKRSVVDRTQLSPAEAIDLVRLTMLAGEAMVCGMAKRGVEIGRINYQDNGNWKPEFHLHLYGRAVDAMVQKYGDPVVPGHRSEFKPLDKEDIAAICAEIETLQREPKFSPFAWRLV